MPAIRRTLKNVVKNYSECQVKVREATSNDPWGPSSTLMSEISDLTYNVVAFTEIMQMVWKRLNDDGKNWRHVYKSLVVLDYIIKTGSEKVAQQCKENFHAIKTLTSFQYIDADHKDQGMNVREKAKQLVNMLSDDERLKNERAKALKAKERYALNAQGVGSRPGAVRLRTPVTDNTHRTGYTDTPSYPDSSPGSGSAGTPSEIENARPSSAGEEELQLQLALAMSKEEHDESVRKQKSDDIKLQMALEQSREQAKSPGGTLLDLAGPSSAGAQAASTDPWGAPLPSQPAPPSTDPWGAPLPPPASNPDPWGTSGGGRAEPPPAYSPTMGGSASIPAQPAQPLPDPWGLPVATPAPPPGAWASTSPTLPQGTSWGGSSSAFPQQTPSSNLDPFGAPTTNGASSVNTLDNEFDLLSARSSDSSPVKSPQGLEEFDTLAGGTQANGSSPDAWDMSGMDQGLHDGKKKDAKDFLGANANLVNLDQLVSKAPPKGNNPFAMMPEASNSSNPFQDPNANVRRPMAQMQASSHNQGFSQPVSSGGLLPAPLLPMGSNPPLQQQPPPAAQQSYNPFL